MLKTSGIIKLTLRENLRGQLLWTSAIVGVILLTISALMSGIALTREFRVIDVFSYFAADQLLTVVALLSGSSVCSIDFSARGLGELFIPSGTPRSSIYLARLSAHATVLLALSIAFFCMKAFLLPLFAEFPKETDLNIQLTMFLFSWFKSLTVLAIAGFLGSLVRPLFSILGTFTLFSFGHLTAAFDSLLNTSQALNSSGEMSQTSKALYLVLKIWNPNLLIVNSSKGEWLQPSGAEITLGLSWALSFIFLSFALTSLGVRKIDLRS